MKSPTCSPNGNVQPPFYVAEHTIRWATLASSVSPTIWMLWIAYTPCRLTCTDVVNRAKSAILIVYIAQDAANRARSEKDDDTEYSEPPQKNIHRLRVDFKMLKLRCGRKSHSSASRSRLHSKPCHTSHRATRPFIINSFRRVSFLKCLTVNCSWIRHFNSDSCGSTLCHHDRLFGTCDAVHDSLQDVYDPIQ